jgi:hypothetical protein
MIGNNRANSDYYVGGVQHVRISNIARTAFPYTSFLMIINEPSSAAGDPVPPPITGTPDLAVLSMSTYPNSGGVLVQAVVRNQGNVSTQNGFYTDLYADHLPTGAGDVTGSIRYWVASPIAAGQTITLTTVVTSPIGVSLASAAGVDATSEVTKTLYLQTDSTGAVTEPDNANNISSGTAVCFAAQDAYEGDDSAAAARLIGLGQAQVHNIGGPGDNDWLKFDAVSGVTYRLRTSDLGPSADTYLYLYDTDGVTLLASNDDYGGSLASQIEWTAPATGIYYVLIQHWNPNVGGCGTSFTIDVTALPPPPVSDLSARRTDEGITFAWSQTGTGISHYEVWRSASPYFNPDVSDPDTTRLGQIAPPDLTFTDNDPTLVSEIRYFYIIRTVNAAGVWADSNRMGMFNFAVLPGD